LLAPAGGPEAARAALTYGADAIYLGLQDFSARAEAENFSLEALDEITAYAHSLPRPRRVYAALNTLVLNRELDRAVRLLERLAEMRVDAVIVQDAGIAMLARAHLPDMRLHASTQMTAHSVEGVRALARLGFSRVVLARELTMDEVRRIVRDGGLEIEVFIHGTLCYSYSGLCLFSSHATGRSGNRGRCTYCCRTMFRSGDDEFMPFSMKDLAMRDRIQPLRQTGVASLKIEGRMKSPLYVSAVTDYYRRLLDDGLPAPDQRRLEEDIRTIFSRPWTHLHADRQASPDEVVDARTTGHRGARIGSVSDVRHGIDGDWLEFDSRRALEIRDGLQVDLPGESKPYGFPVDRLRAPGRREGVVRLSPGPVAIQLPDPHPFVPAGAPVYCASSQEVKRRYPVDALRRGEHRCRHPLRVGIRIGSDALHVHGEATVPVLGRIAAEVRIAESFALARTASGTPDAARKALSRLGDTEWVAERVELEDPDGLFVPASMWNEGRRRLAAAMTGALESAREAWVRGLPAPAREAGGGAEYWSLRLGNWPEDAGPGDWDGADEIVAPLSARIPLEKSGRIRVALPLLLRGASVRDTRKKMSAILRAGCRRWEISSLAGLEILREEAAAAGVDWAALDISADWSLHTLNGSTARRWDEQGIRHFVTSPEDDGENLRDLLRVAGRSAWVLVAQFSPLFMAATGPAGPPGADVLYGRRGERYVEHVADGLHVLTAATPFGLTQHLPELKAAGAAGFRVDLSYAAAVGANPLEIWRAARRGEPLPGAHDGNYRSGLL
jgi:putative protease